jgi:hypothetical protein
LRLNQLRHCRVRLNELNQSRPGNQPYIYLCGGSGIRQRGYCIQALKLQHSARACIRNKRKIAIKHQSKYGGNNEKAFCVADSVNFNDRRIAGGLRGR